MNGLESSGRWRWLWSCDVSGFNACTWLHELPAGRPATWRCLPGPRQPGLVLLPRSQSPWAKRGGIKKEDGRKAYGQPSPFTYQLFQLWLRGIKPVLLPNSLGLDAFKLCDLELSLSLVEVFTTVGMADNPRMCLARERREWMLSGPVSQSFTACFPTVSSPLQPSAIPGQGCC